MKFVATKTVLKFVQDREIHRSKTTKEEESKITATSSSICRRYIRKSSFAKSHIFSSSPPKCAYKTRQTHRKQEAKTLCKRGKERKIHTVAMEKLRSNIYRGEQEAQDSRQKCISKTTVDRLPDVSGYTEKPCKCQRSKE